MYDGRTFGTSLRVFKKHSFFNPISNPTSADLGAKHHFILHLEYFISLVSMLIELDTSKTTQNYFWNDRIIQKDSKNQESLADFHVLPLH